MKKLPIKKMTPILGLFILSFLVIANTAMAQFRIGASYEHRNSYPHNGFGIRLEPQLFKAAIFELDARANFSFFSEKNSASKSGLTYDRNFKDYEIGVSGVGRLDLGIIDPFVTIGVGNTTYKLNDNSKKSLFYTGSVGVQANPIPLIKPFIEYQLTGCNLKDIQTQAQNYSPDNSTGRLILGIYLSF